MTRLLIRTPNWLGDAVMAIPAMAAVRAAYPEAHLALAAPASIAPLFEERTPVAQSEILTITTASAEEKLLRSGSFDASLLLPNSFRSAWNARRARIGERWGYGGNLRGWLLTRSAKRPKETIHQSAYYLALVRSLGIDAADAPPTLSVREQTVKRADALLASAGVDLSTPLVGYAPGAAYGHAKRWPPVRVAELIARVAREPGATSVLLGAGDDRDAGREIESSLPPGVRAVNLIGRTDLRQLAGIIARCRAFVSNDSGAMHLAAALGVRVAAIFGPTDDRVTAPLGDHAVLIHQVFCRPCMLRDCPIDHRCMKGITVDAVFGALAGRLDAAPEGAGAGPERSGPRV